MYAHTHTQNLLKPESKYASSKWVRALTFGGRQDLGWFPEYMWLGAEGPLQGQTAGAGVLHYSQCGQQNGSV